MPHPDDAPRSRRDELELEAALRSVARAQQQGRLVPEQQGDPDPAQPEPDQPDQGLLPVPGAEHAPGRGGRRSSGLAGVVVLTLLWLGSVMLADDDDGVDESRYDRPPQFTAGEGSYAFLRTHPDTGAPIGFDPCRPIRYQVNPDGAPSDWRELVDDGVAHVEWATGLDLVDAGTTTTRPFDPNRLDHALGEQPVVIGFADESELPRLAGEVVGLGGGVPGNITATHAYFGTGSIALDSAYFDGPSSGERRAAFQAVVDHELGHVVGLGHVDDADELMNEANVGVRQFGPGDLEGLSMVGEIPCQ